MTALSRVIVVCACACAGEEPRECDYDLGEYCGRHDCPDLPENVATHPTLAAGDELRECLDELYEVTDWDANKDATVLLYYARDTGEVIGVAVYTGYSDSSYCEVVRYGDPPAQPCPNPAILIR